MATGRALNFSDTVAVQIDAALKSIYFVNKEETSGLSTAR